LRHFEGTPQLPGGYASMLLPAYIPSWWFSLMDPKVVEHYKGDLSRINFDPERRDELVAKYSKLAISEQAAAELTANAEEKAAA